ncbi:lysoplasmalogenase [Paenibacillus rhizovicinus]|uniref:Lysoplasmalogenase n=2 Tax=Paenibacillus rhizovicinus TaxID=2704463 RepID=A0A6C0P9F5_9BACL|nr:lysoplasmalogenase [Paenibacillus rhizovicinus]
MILGNNRLPMLILLVSILYIFVIPAEPMAVKLLFKLIPMWLVIWYAYLRLPAAKKRKRYHGLLLTGLFFCMLGDGLLHWFVAGLSAFLIGHLFYMSGFFSNWRFSKLRCCMAVPIALYGSFMGREIVHALMRDDKESLIVPVLFYVCVISLMTWSAIMTGHKWAIVGSLLFTISDSILSWNMFVSEFAYANVLIMTTYYTAQFCIARSIRTLGAVQAPPAGPAIPTARRASY